MDGRLPLPTLLSHVLVAFTIEFDNEFEHQTPHRTTNRGSTANSSHAPWLVSMVMWWKFMRFVPDEGISAGDLRRRMGATDKDMHAWLTRMGQWWGYVTIEPAFASNRSKRIPPNAVVRPTTGGRKGPDGMANAGGHHRKALARALWRRQN